MIINKGECSDFVTVLLFHYIAACFAYTSWLEPSIVNSSLCIYYPHMHTDGLIIYIEVLHIGVYSHQLCCIHLTSIWIVYRHSVWSLL